MMIHLGLELIVSKSKIISTGYTGTFYHHRYRFDAGKGFIIVGVFKGAIRSGSQHVANMILNKVGINQTKANNLDLLK